MMVRSIFKTSAAFSIWARLQRLIIFTSIRQCFITSRSNGACGFWSSWIAATKTRGVTQCLPQRILHSMASNFIGSIAHASRLIYLSRRETLYWPARLPGARQEGVGLSLQCGAIDAKSARAKRSWPIGAVERSSFRWLAVNNWHSMNYSSE